MKLSKAFELDDFSDYDNDDDDEEDDDDDYEDDSSEDRPDEEELNDDIRKLEGYPKTNKREGFLQVFKVHEYIWPIIINSPSRFRS